MLFLCTLFIAITALLHILFFKLESLDFMKERTLKKFGLNAEQGEVAKVWAFNQGFYNLFLALGLVYAAILLHTGQAEAGKILARFILLSITGAGAVLFFSARQKYAAALVQSVPALIGFLTSFLN